MENTKFLGIFFCFFIKYVTKMGTDSVFFPFLRVEERNMHFLLIGNASFLF